MGRYILSWLQAANLVEKTNRCISRKIMLDPEPYPKDPVKVQVTIYVTASRFAVYKPQ